MSDKDQHSGHLEDQHLKKNIFQVPEGYFEQLSEKINARINEEVKETKVIPLYRQSWVKYAAAVVLLVIVSVVALIVNRPSTDISFATLSNDEIIEYLWEEGISNDDILASLDDPEDMLNNLIAEELSSYSMGFSENPELEYDFEYLEY